MKKRVHFCNYKVHIISTFNILSREGVIFIFMVQEERHGKGSQMFVAVCPSLGINSIFFLTSVLGYCSLKLFMIARDKSQDRQETV